MKLIDSITALHGAPFHSFEFFPPRTPEGLANLLDRIQRMTSPPLAAPLAISVTWGAGGSTAVRSLELAAEIVKMNLGRGRVEVILHMTCTNMSRKMLDEALKKCHDLGIQNILALRGDPPRKEEYRPAPGPDLNLLANSSSQGGDVDLDDIQAEEEEEDEVEFEYAEDLVRYINREWKGWFCIGVAGYPTPHVDSPTPESDIHHLARKVQAGAHFIITQLFYDVEGFLGWVGRVREAGVDVPIIPGIMPIQNYASFRRLTNLTKCPVPAQVASDLDAIKSDDAAVKRYGIQLATKMIQQITSSPSSSIHSAHFCTLNLEKSVRQILENVGWLSSCNRRTTNRNASPSPHRNKLIDQNQTMAPLHGASEPHNGVSGSPSKQLLALSISPSEASHLAEYGFKHRRGSSFSEANRLGVPNLRGQSQSHGGQAQGAVEEEEDDSTVPPPALASNGNGNGNGQGQNENGTGAGGAPTGGNADDWDEFPNGRFTDVRSPAYGEIDGWGNGLKITPSQALKDWGAPVDSSSLSSLFCRYLSAPPSSPLTTPFCDLPLSPESQPLLPHLLYLNSASKKFWTVGSQPAVDGAKSEDPVHGFGPKGGYVFQKSFVEFFVEGRGVVEELVGRVEGERDGRISLYAGNKDGDFITNMPPGAVNAVTWAVFPGQEIVQSTIIEEVSFLAWKEEAFEIWTEWSRLYPLKSASRKLLEGISEGSWLVSLIHHDYKDEEGLWRFLREE